MTRISTSDFIDLVANCAKDVIPRVMNMKLDQTYHPEDLAYPLTLIVETVAAALVNDAQ